MGTFMYAMLITLLWLNKNGRMMRPFNNHRRVKF